MRRKQRHQLRVSIRSGPNVSEPTPLLHQVVNVCSTSSSYKQMAAYLFLSLQMSTQDDNRLAPLESKCTLPLSRSPLMLLLTSFVPTKIIGYRLAQVKFKFTAFHCSKSGASMPALSHGGDARDSWLPTTGIVEPRCPTRMKQKSFDFPSKLARNIWLASNLFRCRTPPNR